MSGRLSCFLAGELSLVGLFRHPLGRLKNKLANGHSRSQLYVHWAVIDHFELYGAHKASVNGWSRNVYSQAKPCQPTLAFDAGRDFAFQIQLNSFPSLVSVAKGAIALKIAGFLRFCSTDFS
jgi:hypothetical protein